MSLLPGSKNAYSNYGHPKTAMLELIIDLCTTRWAQEAHNRTATSADVEAASSGTSIIAEACPKSEMKEDNVDLDDIHAVGHGDKLDARLGHLADKELQKLLNNYNILHANLPILHPNLPCPVSPHSKFARLTRLIQTARRILNRSEFGF